AHAYRSEDYEGVKEFARGCMRTYLILKEKGERWNRDPEVKSLLAEIARLDANGGGGFDRGRNEELLAREFDRAELASKGLKYERLDQLTIDILLGVR
ncbi:MAG: xylose isomerase, partial [Acidobacteria bacterium]|nr:xylose isomerase [Acidobacteriota bacterium]